MGVCRYYKKPMCYYIRASKLSVVGIVILSTRLSDSKDIV
jgi:hypothetical protein